MVQLCSRFNRATKLVNFDGAVTGLNDVRERLGKTDRAFLFVCLFFPTNPLFPRVWQDRGRMSHSPKLLWTLFLPHPSSPANRHGNKCKQARQTAGTCCLGVQGAACA